MWIRTQDKQRILNSDRITDIFVDNTGIKICANINGYIKPIILGEYKDSDTCIEILEHILTVIGTNMSGTTMPLGDDVASWEKEMCNSCEPTTNLVSFHEINRLADFAIKVTGQEDDYFIGMCNGIECMRSTLTHTTPNYLESTTRRHIDG